MVPEGIINSPKWPSEAIRPPRDPRDHPVSTNTRQMLPGANTNEGRLPPTQALRRRYLRETLKNVLLLNLATKPTGKNETNYYCCLPRKTSLQPCPPSLPAVANRCVAAV